MAWEVCRVATWSALPPKLPSPHARLPCAQEAHVSGGLGVGREVKWALESITMNNASGGDGIPVELFQILKDDAVKALHSICQQIWKTQQRP